MRILIQAFSRTLLDLELLPARAQAVIAVTEAPLGHDPHSTTGAQVEQAYEPPVGFGLTARVEARDGRRAG